MVVRRNDRRRRVKSDEYGLTVYQDDPEDDREAVDGDPGEHRSTNNARRTYASAADRRNQLRTTDLFPKRTWLTSTFGLLLVSIIVSLNVLAWFAPTWALTSGPDAVASLSLGGAGTLTQFFIVVTMLLSAAISLQIYVLRKHRCDDYCGTYRIWKWIPPLFAFASLAAIVDLRPAAEGLLLAATGQAIQMSAAVTIVLISLAMTVLFFRMLFEVRESRATVATFVISWIALSVAVVSQAAPVAQSIAASDQSLLIYNSLMLAAASLLAGHLFYARFVYLHAHGLIVKRKRTPKKQKLKIDSRQAAEPAKGKKARSSQKDTATDTATDIAAEASDATPAQATGTTRKSSRRKAKSKPNVAKKEAIASFQAGDTTATESKKTAESEASRPTTMASFQALLASRKQATGDANTGNQPSGTRPAGKTQSVEQDDQPAVVSMTKAQKRKARKDRRSQKRAA